MNKIDHIQEIDPRFEQIEEVEKFNPYHDNRGRFSSSNGYASFTIQTKDPNKQHWADMAVARMGGKPIGGGKKPVAPAKPQPVDTSKPPAGTKTQTDHPPGKKLSGDEAAEFVAKQTGASMKEAKKMFSAQNDFTDGSFSKIREAGFKGSPPASKKDKEKADLIDKMIEESPKFDGEVFRGIGTNAETAKKIVQQAAAGHLINQMGASSFSTERDVAESFAEGNSEGATVIFVSKGVQNGTSVRPTSQFPHENEVLMSSQAVWKPTGKITESGTTWHKSYVIEMEPFWGDPAAYEAEIPKF